MAVTAKLFGSFLVKALNKEIDLDSDTIKVMLATSAWTPNQDTNDYKNDVTNEVIATATTLSSSAAAGATTISVAASIPVGTAVLIDAAGAPEVRTVTAVAGSGPYTLTIAALTSAHASGQTVQASPGYTAGGATLTGVAVTYDAGTNVLKIDADDVSWAASTITARYAVIYDSTPATDATRPLLGYVDFGDDVISNAGAFTIAWNAAGMATLTVA